MKAAHSTDIGSLFDGEAKHKDFINLTCEAVKINLSAKENSIS